MRNVLKIAIATIMLTSLTACVVVPPQTAYVEPGVTVVAPAPYYGAPYGHRHHHHRHHRHDRWDRRW